MTWSKYVIVKSSMPKVVNGFPFFNELKLLHFKLVELWDVMDTFIIVESCQTHSGEHKPFYLEEHLGTTLASYASKIVYIKLEDAIEGEDAAWRREVYQRNMIMKGVEKLHLQDEDILLIGDLDEIPDPFYVSKMKKGELVYHVVARLRQDMYYYNLTCKSVVQFTGLFYISYRRLMDMLYDGVTLNSIRRMDLPRTEYCHGWHLSYFGDIHQIQKKLKSFVHHNEYDQAKFTKEFLEECIVNHRNIFHTETEIDKYDDFVYIPIHENEYLPKHYNMLMESS